MAGAEKIAESMRSRTPPWPGKRFAHIFNRHIALDCAFDEVS